MSARIWLVLLTFFSVTAGSVSAQTTPAYKNAAIPLSVTINRSPPQITLKWTPLTGAQYTVYRQPLNGSAWSLVATPPINSTSWTDTNVVIGTPYEYRVSRGFNGYTVASIDRPVADYNGKLILVVDDTMAAPFANEITRLIQDLNGAGWTVIRHDVPRFAKRLGGWKDAVVATRNLIKADYDADPANVKAVYILGRVPTPYSGSMNMDGHGSRPAAADAYYADMDTTWTDVNMISPSGDGKNIPGDGLFDHNTVPGDSRIELQIGRVDFCDMPVFAPRTEVDLLRRYLDKSHNFRLGLITARARGSITPGFSFGAESGWGNFPNFFGTDNVVETKAADYFPTLAANDYLWNYTAAGSSQIGGQGAAGVAATDIRTMFSMIFGSYSGRWDGGNNVTRSLIATPTYTLTAEWTGYTDFYYQSLDNGETFGSNFKRRLMPHYAGDNDVYHALMGDPSLKMWVVAPVGTLTGTKSGSVNLQWGASSESGIAGYNVYRSASPTGPFTKLTPTAITGTSFTDASPLVGNATYMVRVLKLMTTNSGGSYWELSQGKFITIGNTPNSAPSALNQSVSTAVDTQVAVTLAGTDAQSDTLAYYMVIPPKSGHILGSPPNLTYIPKTGFNGTDTFTFYAADGKTESNIATVTINVGGANQPPAAPRNLRVQ